jgi:hypothetical protein
MGTEVKDLYNGKAQLVKKGPLPSRKRIPRVYRRCGHSRSNSRSLSITAITSSYEVKPRRW